MKDLHINTKYSDGTDENLKSLQTLTFLGKDSGFGEKNNSSYIEIENKLILIDCGFTVFQQVKNKYNFENYESIHIIITHLHNDHAGSLSQLILYLWFIYHKKVNIFSKCEHIKDYLDITGTPPEAYELRESIDNLKFIKTTHTLYLDAYGFILKIKNRTILYTGDTNTLEPFYPYLDKINEFYFDASRFGGAHIKIDDILGVLKKIKEKGIDIIPMHLDDREYIEKLIKTNFSNLNKQ